MHLHRFSRTELLIGTDGLARLQGSHVAVIGLGGVGSYVAEALCRSGLGRLTIIDFDDVCISNLNRQLQTTMASVGRPKVEVMAERLLSINPGADIVAIRQFYSAESSDLLLSGRFDYLVDAIDNITAKVHLLKTCRGRGIPVISSMGAASKMDPTKVRVGDISRTHTCRMARTMRKLLRREGIASGIKVVYSTEEPACSAGVGRPAPQDGAERVEGVPTGPRQRVVLGSCAHLPGIFGLTIAGEVLRDLLGRRRAQEPDH